METNLNNIWHFKNRYISISRRKIIRF